MVNVELSDLAYVADVPALPVGPAPGADTRTRTKAVLYGWDEAGRLATLANADTGAAGSVVPAVGDYDWTALIGRPVWVLRDPISGRQILVLGPVSPSTAVAEPRTVSSLRTMVSRLSRRTTGTVTATDAGGVTVDTEGATVLCSTLAGTVAVGDEVLVHWADVDDPWVLGTIGIRAEPESPATPDLAVHREMATVLATWPAVEHATSYRARRWDAEGGWSAEETVTETAWTTSIAQGQDLIIAVRAVNRTDASLWAQAEVSYPPPEPPDPEPVTRTVTVLPVWSGTYRSSKQEWDAWNLDQGRSILYQGASQGSGPLIGLAAYGDRITTLDADEIVSADLVLRAALPGSQQVVVQAAEHAERPTTEPRPAGETFTVAVHPGQPTRVELPDSIRDALASGQVRSLCLVGDDYAAVPGTAAPDGMSLAIVYRKRE